MSKKYRFIFVIKLVRCHILLLDQIENCMKLPAASVFTALLGDRHPAGKHCDGTSSRNIEPQQKMCIFSGVYFIL